MLHFRTIACVFLVAAAGGCASKFSGEWLEEGAFARDGTFAMASGSRRAALQFIAPSTVRYGRYVNAAGVVDSQGLQQDTFFTMSKGNVAQFGATIARLKGDRIITFIGAEPNREFVRLRTGRSVFPPVAILPSLVKAAPSLHPEELVVPVMAFISPRTLTCIGCGTSGAGE